MYLLRIIIVLAIIVVQKVEYCGNLLLRNDSCIQSELVKTLYFMEYSRYTGCHRLSLVSEHIITCRCQVVTSSHIDRFRLVTYETIAKKGGKKQ